MGLLDRFRRMVGLKEKEQQPAAPATPPPASPTPPAQESFMRSAPPTAPAANPQPAPLSAPPVPTRAPARPDPAIPSDTKPVHSVSERRPGRHGTAPLVNPSDSYRPPDAPKDTRKQAEEYLDRLQSKISQLADDFAEGVINREQFQRLYEHYQRERRGVENLLTVDLPAPDVKVAANEGQSIVIRKQHIARAIGYSIYENLSGMPITTLGSFELDPALVIPMLSSFRAATQEIFGAGIRSTAIEGGRWVCFVPGELTTLLAIFSNEPAQKQMTYLEDLHRLFEKANRRHLLQSPVTAAALLFPHEFYLKS
jgi:hypothetical protein